MQSANQHQEGGSHYAAKYQHWDFVRQCLAGRYLEGNLTKYIARWRKKNGLQDIRKAIHYLEKIRELHLSYLLDPPHRLPHSDAIDEFCSENDLGPLESRVMFLCATWENAQDLLDLKTVLQALESECLLTKLS